ncbi:hypothetical protein P691DRAFT_737025 [Macrolepiota fuliginosa MF-IS2]|uniref:FHA domain-containing protein n=1 Tax=Macrolepiota fuliginosa MF-IS2 TaxID=1400762 RepID=A0A9P5X3C7_9AGAR|nr:hypothetical protein P691DRAFT_737025 [Macrolepiota fuliginosa MF-IS2]
MIDDDIQYIGSSIKLRDPPRYPQRTVTSVVLHIEKSDGNDAHVLTFNRDTSSTVHIGRRPGTEIESRTLDQEKGRAMFRCAVVSRKHARIAFTDSGNVYLIDLHSHHGTHIRKPGETSSRILEPEIPTPLSDGDIITFGKSVGRNEEMVRPVVARVQLLYNGPSTSTIKPLVVPDSSPMSNRSHSGRYGLHSPSSSSSDEAYNGQSDTYSDIEEIPPPPRHTSAISASQDENHSKIGRAFEVLKRLLPPTSIPSVPAVPRLEISPRLEEQSPIQFASPSPSSSASMSPTGLPPLWSFPLLPSISPDSIVDIDPTYFLHHIDMPNVNNDANRSRSESPMDLASPSPSLPEQEPHIIGAWADYASPSSSTSESEAIATPPDNNVASSSGAAEISFAVQHEERREAEGSAVDENVAPSPSAIEKEKEKEKSDPPTFVTKVDYEELKAKYTRLQDEIDDLQIQRRKYKSKFNANVHTVTDKFHELEDRVNDMSAQYSLFMDQIESVTHGDVPDLQAQIDDLLDQQGVGRMDVEQLKRGVAECTEKISKVDEDMKASKDRDVEMRDEKEEVQRYLNTLRGLVEEMKTLRNLTEQEVKTELETLHQLRESILKDAEATPLKRKRSIEDEGDRDTTTDEHAEVPTNGDVTMHSATLRPCGVEIQIHDRPSPRKRARKFVSVAAQTATAVTMGAVATWVALAFS